MSKENARNCNMQYRLKHPLKLEEFRDVLIRQEETIIFALIERAQFPLNNAAYQPVGSDEIPRFKGRYQHFQGSFLDFLFMETEKLHSLVRRYTSPDEQPFYSSNLIEPLLPAVNYSQVIQPNNININSKIKSIYLNKILPKLTRLGKLSTTYGSSTTCDIAVLQALSKRIHYGKYIAEAKFQANPTIYSSLILANDAEGLLKELTNQTVEQKVIKRVALKASTYGQDIDGSNGDAEETPLRVDPKLISELYQDFVMPLTKEVQVEYLLQRLDHDSVAYLGPPGNLSFRACLQKYGKANSRLFTPEDSISQVFQQILSNKVAYGIVPLEDSERGMFKETQSQLIASTLQICGEIYVKKSYVIAVKANFEEDMTSFNTFPNSFHKIIIPLDAEAICSSYLEGLEHLEHITVDNVVEAARQVSSYERTAAITSDEAAAAMNLRILDRQIEGNSSSSTRFAILSKQIASPSGDDKTCACMNIKHRAGGLAGALSIFSNHGINLTCLESFPCLESYQYNFWIEMDGHAQDPLLLKVMKELEQHVTKIRILGSYARASSDEIFKAE